MRIPNLAANISSKRGRETRGSSAIAPPRLNNTIKDWTISTNHDRSVRGSGILFPSLFIIKTGSNSNFKRFKNNFIAERRI